MNDASFHRLQFDIAMKTLRWLVSNADAELLKRIQKDLRSDVLIPAEKRSQRIPLVKDKAV
jgi:hypothetical protein